MNPGTGQRKQESYVTMPPETGLTQKNKLNNSILLQALA